MTSLQLQAAMNVKANLFKMNKSSLLDLVQALKGDDAQTSVDDVKETIVAEIIIHLYPDEPQLWEILPDTGNVFHLLGKGKGKGKGKGNATGQIDNSSESSSGDDEDNEHQEHGGDQPDGGIDNSSGDDEDNEHQEHGGDQPDGGIDNSSESSSGDDGKGKGKGKGGTVLQVAAFIAALGELAELEEFAPTDPQWFLSEMLTEEDVERITNLEELTEFLRSKAKGKGKGGGKGPNLETPESVVHQEDGGDQPDGGIGEPSARRKGAVYNADLLVWMGQLMQATAKGRDWLSELRDSVMNVARGETPYPPCSDIEGVIAHYECMVEDAFCMALTEARGGYEIKGKGKGKCGKGGDGKDAEGDNDAAPDDALAWLQKFLTMLQKAGFPADVFLTGKGNNDGKGKK